ncbi:hypothetical protein GCM10020216_107430 [Nonomuraea helvata]
MQRRRLLTYSWAMAVAGAVCPSPKLLGSLLSNNVVPPAQEAAVYQAMAKVTRSCWTQTTYTYLGARDVAIADYTSRGMSSASWRLAKSACAWATASG